MLTLRDKAAAAKAASRRLATLDGNLKNRAIKAIAQALEQRMGEIAAANREDCERSEREGVAEPVLKRLAFGEAKIRDVIDGLRSLQRLEEPVGRTTLATELDTGLELYRVTCPIGVAGIIFEARPDALVQISSLCLKSGNAVLLKGGSEAALTNRVLAEIIADASVAAGMPEGWIQLVETRADVNEMFTLNAYIDLLIPRGSNAFVQYIMEHSSIPVLGHADGVCHLYFHEDADRDLVAPIILDSKTQYVAACNTVENILVNEACAAEVLPIIHRVLGEAGVEMVGCPRSVTMLGIAAATEEDWDTEYVDYKVAIRVVAGFDEAVAFINTHGSGHTDSIITQSREMARRFLAEVDSACVFHNCSTRFSDGFRFGFGAEVGISTGKIHARGPVGLDGLLIYKYKLLGSGQVVGDYATRRSRFTHRPLAGSCPL